MAENILTQLDPAAVVAEAEKQYHRGQCDGAIDLLVAAGEQMAPDRQIKIKLAELLMDSEQFADALAVINKIPDKGNDIHLAALKGCCEAGMGDYRDALQSAEQMLAGDQDNPTALNLKGIVAYQTGSLESAERFFKKAITRDPDYGEVYKNLGLVRKKSGDSAAALALFENGFRRSPTIRNVVLTYHSELVSQSDFGQAEEIFRAAAEKHPGNQRLSFLYIDILLRLGKTQPALDIIQDCLVRFGPDEGLLEAALQVRGQLDESEVDQARNGDQRISLCMIVKNEESHLARCLASVRKLVDETIIVDTGSTDLTGKIGRVFGARIYEYRWENDFARARNFSLSKATGDWVLILDADEVISSQDRHRLRLLVNGHTSAARAFSLTTRNYTHQANLVGWTANQGDYQTEETGSGWYPSPKVRLFPNDPRIRFSYPIHELVEPSLESLGIQVASCPVPVHHYGKLGGNRNDKKAIAYYDLGIKKLAALGDNAVALRELAVQAAGLEKFEQAVDLWRRYLKLDPQSAEAYVNMGTACWQLADYHSAAQHAEKAIALAPDFKEAHFNSALAQLYLGDCTKTIDILEVLIEANPQYLAARFMLASAYACAGDQEKARTGFKRIHLQISDFELNAAVSDVMERLSKAKLNQFAENLRLLVH